MGSILSRFRKRQTATEKLIEVVKEIRAIEEEKSSTQKWEKRVVTNFLTYSVLTYLVAIAVYFVFLMPPSPKDKIIHSVPMMVFPLIIYGGKRFVNWYYSGKLQREQERLIDLYKEKAKLVDQVMETETFKVAREVLEKYAPEQLRKLTPKEDTDKPDRSRSILNSPLGSPMGMGTDVRQRILPPTASQSRISSPMRPGPIRPGTPTGPPSQIRPPAMRNLGTNFGSMHRGPFMGPPPGPPLPRPIPSRDRSLFRQVIDGFLGEGPGSNYALICKQCLSHNGLATPGEFEYLAFRCAYCYTLNPARKPRPLPPRLPEYVPPRPESAPGSPRPSPKGPSNDGGVSIEPGRLQKAPSESNVGGSSSVTSRSGVDGEEPLRRRERGLSEGEGMAVGIVRDESLDVDADTQSEDATGTATMESEEIEVDNRGQEPEEEFGIAEGNEELGHGEDEDGESGVDVTEGTASSPNQTEPPEPSESSGEPNLPDEPQS